LPPLPRFVVYDNLGLRYAPASERQSAIPSHIFYMRGSMFRAVERIRLTFVCTFVHTHNMVVAGFEWDEGNRAKCEKHGVSIADIEFVMQNEPRVAPDRAHSVAESRLIAIGRSTLGRPVFIAFTLRIKAGDRYIRPISARFMHQKEVDAYEKEGS